MGNYRLISADSHVVEPGDLFQKRLPAGLRDRAPKLAPWNGGSAWTVDGLDPVPLPVSAATGSGYRLPKGDGAKAIAFEDVLPGLYDPAERIKAQDMDSVDAEIIYSSPGLWDAIKRLDDPDLKLACVQAYNDWIAEFTSHSPDRLIGLGKIPSANVDDPRNIEDANAELLRCVERLKLRGVVLDAWPGGSIAPGDPGADAFWDTVNETGVPVSIHYALGPQSRTAPYPGMAPGRNPPMAQMALPLIYTGVFDRCPNIRVVFAHGNAGWAPHWLEHSDIGYIRRKHLMTTPLKQEDWLPSDYIRRHFWFTIQRDRSAILVRNMIGAAHLLWASHFPLDAADWPDNRQQAAQLTEEVPEETRQALLAENTARLYRLPGYEKGFDPAMVESFDKLVHL